MSFASKPPACYGCPLQTKGKGFIQAEGKGTLRVLIMGEAPDERGASTSLPLRPEGVGGSVLERAIKRCGFTRDQFRVMETCQCNPPAGKLEGTSYEMQAIEHCSVHRDAMIEHAKASGARAILALGNVPLRTLTGMCGKKRNASQLRGYVLASNAGIPVIPTYHPATLRHGATEKIGVLMADLLKAVNVANNGFDQGTVTYQTSPSMDDAESFLYRVQDNPNALLTYDIENPKSAGQNEDEIKHAEMQDQPITQVQMSLGIGEGIVFPWMEPYSSIFRKCMASSNLKAGHNVWKYDNPILREKYQTVINGRIHDTRWAWHHLQPDLPADLQFVASFYNFPFPWKHMASEDLAFYGAADVDSVQRIMAKILVDLEKRGVLRGYMDHVFGLEPILYDMSNRGIPIDNDYRIIFGERLVTEQGAVGEKIQAAVPTDVVPVHPKEGYKKEPKEITVAKLGPVTPGTIVTMPPRIISGNEVTGLQYRAFDVGLDQKTMLPMYENRWCWLRTFSPNSSDQLIAYMKYRGHPVPIELKGGKDGQDRETTEAEELKKLAKKTGDKFYLDCIEWRKLGKMKSTYVDGWKPKPETNRVHATFSFGPATGQLNSTDPNAQNFPKHSKLAMEARGLICAPDGYVLVEIDYHAFHAQTLALEAGDPDYLRLARADIHSFLAANLLKLPRCEYILEMADDELNEYLGHVKKHHKFIRDKKAKPAILGYGFGLGAKHMFEMNAEVYDPDTDAYVTGIASKKEAQGIIDMIDARFPRVKGFRNSIRMVAHRQTFLQSRHSYLRWFWDVYHYEKRTNQMVSGEDSEKAIAFLPANDAFGHMKDVMRALDVPHPLDERGLNERYGLISNIHDSLIFCCPKKLEEECIYTVRGLMEAPSKILYHPLVAPGGFWCDVEASRGVRWNEMKVVKIAA